MAEVRSLDPEALALFARKGLNLAPHMVQGGEANAVKVRRVMQITNDLAGPSFSDLRILDLGCGEGVYAIEAVCEVHRFSRSMLAPKGWTRERLWPAGTVLTMCASSKGMCASSTELRPADSM
jgi:hypothetical protein